MLNRIRSVCARVRMLIKNIYLVIIIIYIYIHRRYDESLIKHIAHKTVQLIFDHLSLFTGN